MSEERKPTCEICGQPATCFSGPSLNVPVQRAYCVHHYDAGSQVPRPEVLKQIANGELKLS